MKSSSVRRISLFGCGKSDRTAVRTSAPNNAVRDSARVEQVVPPVPESGYLNTDPGVKYVGSEACAECHQDEDKSYRDTTPSRAFGDVVLTAEPSGDEVEYELSGRNDRVNRQDGQLRHRKFIPTEDGSELELANYPMRFVIGSGNHSRSHLVDIDGFLFESPVTWYTSQKSWGMSPGYKENLVQSGFTNRAARLRTSLQAVVGE